LFLCYNAGMLNQTGVNMKRFATLIAGIVIAVSALAEATFDQIEGLIQQQNYAAAAAGLETIIQNHPHSAKAFYAMAQAQAGLGNLEKARYALDKATGLNPTLDFAPASSVASLRDAITPQTAKIEAVEESHALRNFAYFALFAGFAVACYFLYSVYARKQEEEQRERDAEFLREEQERQAEAKRKWQESIAQQEAERKAELAAEAALKAHPNYGHERFDPTNPDKLKTVKQFKAEQAEAQALALRQAQARADMAEEDARRARAQAASQPTTVVHTSSNDGLLTGILIGDMMNHHNHDTTRVVEREVVREQAPTIAPRSSWDDIDTPKSSSRSSSWDDTPSTSRSSSWDSDSSSSSSWSSSSSDSSSSWSSSDSSSSSSWD
jgi:cytochrome c-type biogenesis protein CcmH/NrfG